MAASTVCTRCRCPRSYCGIPGRARQTSTKSGSRRRPATRRRSATATAATASSLASTSVGSKVPPRSTRRSAPPARGAAGENRGLVLAAEDPDPFAAGDHEPVRIEVDAERLCRTEAETGDGHGGVGDGAQGGRRASGENGASKSAVADAGVASTRRSLSKEGPAAVAIRQPPEGRGSMAVTRAEIRRAPSWRASAAGSSPTPSGKAMGRPIRGPRRDRKRPRSTLPWVRSSSAMRGKAAADRQRRRVPRIHPNHRRRDHPLGGLTAETSREEVQHRLVGIGAPTDEGLAHESQLAGCARGASWTATRAACPAPGAARHRRKRTGGARWGRPFGCAHRARPPSPARGCLRGRRAAPAVHARTGIHRGGRWPPGRRGPRRRREGARRAPRPTSRWATVRPESPPPTTTTRTGAMPSLDREPSRGPDPRARR